MIEAPLQPQNEIDHELTNESVHELTNQTAHELTNATVVNERVGNERIRDFVLGACLGLMLCIIVMKIKI